MRIWPEEQAGLLSMPPEEQAGLLSMPPEEQAGLLSMTPGELSTLPINRIGNVFSYLFSLNNIANSMLLLIGRTR